MIRTLLAIIILHAAVLSGQDGGPTVDKTFQLTLSVTSAPGLRVVLQNRSSQEQTVLLFPYRFPSRLTLLDASGQEVKGFDPRTREKPVKGAWEVRLDYYQHLAPGGELEINDQEFWVRGDVPDAWQFKWHSYQFESLPPGKYLARVTWECQEDFWQDEKTGKVGHVPGVWKGRVESNEISFTLPPPPRRNLAPR